MLIYRATNEKTGETITGIAKEIAQKLCVEPRLIRIYACNGYKVSRCWSVEKVTKEDKKAHNIPQSFWDEWLRVTKALRGYAQ